MTTNRQRLAELEASIARQQAERDKLREEIEREELGAPIEQLAAGTFARLNSCGTCGHGALCIKDNEGGLVVIKTGLRHAGNYRAIPIPAEQVAVIVCDRPAGEKPVDRRKVFVMHRTHGLMTACYEAERGLWRGKFQATDFDGFCDDSLILSWCYRPGHKPEEPKA